MMGKTIAATVLILLMLSQSALCAVTFGWKKHVIGDQTTPIYLVVEDMDNDGDLDVATTTNRHPGLYDSEVAWFQNNIYFRIFWLKNCSCSNFITCFFNSS